MHDAMMKDAVAGLQEQMNLERAAVQVEIDKMAAEREVMLAERAADASDKKEKERLEIVLSDLQVHSHATTPSHSALFSRRSVTECLRSQMRYSSMALRTEKAEALLTEHEALKARCDHLEHVATNARKQSGENAHTQ